MINHEFEFNFLNLNTKNNILNEFNKSIISFSMINHIVHYKAIYDYPIPETIKNHNNNIDVLSSLMLIENLTYIELYMSKLRTLLNNTDNLSTSFSFDNYEKSITMFLTSFTTFLSEDILMIPSFNLVQEKTFNNFNQFIQKLIEE